MSSPHRMSLIRRVSFLGIAATVSTGLALAQSNVPTHQANPVSAPASAAVGESSSFQVAEAAVPEGLSLASPAPSAGASGAAGQTRQSWRHAVFSNYALEFGGGFNAPESDTSNYVTWGGQFNVGAGVNFTRRLALLAEYQFMDDKLPGKLIAETGANGGYDHIWSLTLNPVVDLFPKATNDVYLTGGGGFYRKVTSFTDPQEAEYCDYYYCGIGTVNSVVGHFSSNQGGWSAGAGVQHRLGGVNGDGRMKLFAEVRYLDVLTPAVESSPNGLGTTTVAAGTRLIPVTFGVRW